MGQLIVRKIEDAVKARLQQRAKRHGRSMEEEVRDILRNVVNEDEAPVGGLGTEISSLFSKVALDSDIAELRGHKIKPPALEP
jgi:antitoxin FitA